MSTNAERQRAYRQRHLQDVDGAGERLNTVVSVQTKAQLARLAAHHGITQRAVLERLLAAADQARTTLRRNGPGRAGSA